jgi:hypothetical protein
VPRILVSLLIELFILTATLGCRRQLPPTRTSTDSQTAAVATASSSDSQAAGIASTSNAPAGASPVARADTAPAVHFSSPRDSLCGELAENGLKIPDTDRRAVAAQIGRPDSSRSQPTPNPYTTGQIDSVVNVFYPGLRLHYLVLGKPTSPTDIFLEAYVSDNRFLKYPALGVGVSADAIVSALGEPEQRTGDTISYSCALHIMSGSTVYFHLQDGRVKAVQYYFEAD